MIPLITAPPAARFDIETVWRSLVAMGAWVVARTPYFLVGVILVALAALLGRVVRRFFRSLSARSRVDDALAELLGRLAQGLLVVVGILVAAVVTFPSFRPGDLVTALGVGSIAVGFAFKDILQNFLAGILLLWRKPFRVGDEIRTRDHEGTVESIEVRSTRLRTYDDQRVVVPNSEVYTSAIVVHTAYGRRRVTLAVSISYRDSLDGGRERIRAAVEGTAGVLPEPAPWVYVRALAPSSVEFAVYFWVRAPQAEVLRVTDRVATAVQRGLDEGGFAAAYPRVIVTVEEPRPPA